MPTATITAGRTGPAVGNQSALSDRTDRPTFPRSICAVVTPTNHRRAHLASPGTGLPRFSVAFKVRFATPVEAPPITSPMVFRTWPAVTFDPGDGPSRSRDWTNCQVASRRSARDWSNSGPSRQSPSRPEPMSRSSTGRADHHSHPHPRPWCARKRPVPGSCTAPPRARREASGRAGQRLGPPVLNRGTSTKERDDANATGHTDRPAGSGEETARRRPVAADHPRAAEPVRRRHQ